MTKGIRMPSDDERFRKLFDPVEWLTPDESIGWKPAPSPFELRNIDLLMETLADPDEPITKQERALLYRIVKAYDNLNTPSTPDQP